MAFCSEEWILAFQGPRGHCISSFVLQQSERKQEIRSVIILGAMHNDSIELRASWQQAKLDGVLTAS